MTLMTLFLRASGGAFRTIATVVIRVRDGQSRRGAIVGPGRERTEFGLRHSNRGRRQRPSGLQGIGGATASGTPKAEVAGKVYDFGTVLNAVPVAHVFKIHNAGSGTLVIGGVQTSCGCTAAKPTKSQLAAW